MGHSIKNLFNHKASGAILMGALALGAIGCTSNSADVVSENISTAADNFEVNRRIVFYNGITNEYMLTIEGLCSLGNHDAAGTLSVTCKTGEDEYKKHFLGLSDNVTFFVQQTESANVSAYHYRVIFRPETILPDIEMDVSSETQAPAASAAAPTSKPTVAPTTAPTVMASAKPAASQAPTP